MPENVDNLRFVFTSICFVGSSCFINVTGTAGNPHKQNSRFCKEIREDNFRFAGGEFTKTLRKVYTCQQLKFAFLLLEYCKIR